jgi:hypothetical protein
MIPRILGRPGDQSREEAKIDPAARAFLHLTPDGAVAENSGPSAARRAAGLFLALMVLAAMPLFWVASASGHGGDQPAAVKSGSSGPGSGHEDDDEGDDGHGGDDTATGTTRGTGPSNTNTNDTRTGTATDPTGTTRGTGPSNTNTHDTRTGTRTHG